MTVPSPFNAYAKQYDEWFARNSAAYQAELAAMREFLPTLEKGVEIGLGTGRFGGPLGIEIGIEPSQGMCAIARKRGITVVRAVAGHLPLQDSSFDYAVMVTVICFLDDIMAAFKEAWRVLGENGAFVVAFIDKSSPLGKEYEERKQMSRFYKGATFYSVREVVSFLNHAGFKATSFRQAICEDSRGMEQIGEVREGHGEGSFVVVKAIKQGC